MSNKAKYLVNCLEGENNIERASVSFVLATTASKTNETAVFITSDATYLMVKGKTDGLVAEGMEPIADLIQQFLGNGGKIWVCPVCVNSKGLTADDLIDGVEVAGAPKTMEYLATGGMLLH